MKSSFNHLNHVFDKPLSFLLKKIKGQQISASKMMLIPYFNHNFTLNYFIAGLLNDYPNKGDFVNLEHLSMGMFNKSKGRVIIVRHLIIKFKP